MIPRQFDEFLAIWPVSCLMSSTGSWGLVDRYCSVRGPLLRESLLWGVWVMPISVDMLWLFMLDQTVDRLLMHCLSCTDLSWVWSTQLFNFPQQQQHISWRGSARRFNPRIYNSCIQQPRWLASMSKLRIKNDWWLTYLTISY